ncbi:MAG: DUF5989 family protein [Kiloniellales bacterium]
MQSSLSAGSYSSAGRPKIFFWLLPLFIMMFLFGGLLVLAEGSAVAPFIYTIF